MFLCRGLDSYELIILFNQNDMNAMCEKIKNLNKMFEAVS